MKRLRPVIILVLVLACSSVMSLAGAIDNASGDAVWGQMKSLVGTWDGTSAEGKTTERFELSSLNSALVEHSQKGTENEAMLTVYYRDGARVMLTHYCGAGNQPRMVAANYDPATKTLEFKFLDVTNLESTPGYMKSVTFHFEGDDHYTAHWVWASNGKETGSDFHYTRVKA
jgi:hypothetical protein